MNLLLKNKFFKPFLVTLALIYWLATSEAQGAANSPVSYRDALSDASSIAQLNTNWNVMRCSGASMEPFYSSDSILVVDKVKVADLRIGMIAVYRDADGDLVAHKVIEANSSQAWAKGVNNTHRDPTPITADNLSGVVFTVLHTSGQSSAGDMAMVNSLPIVFGKTYE